MKGLLVKRSTYIFIIQDISQQSLACNKQRLRSPNKSYAYDY